MKAEFELILKAEEARVGRALQAVMEGGNKINIGNQWFGEVFLFLSEQVYE